MSSKDVVNDGGWAGQLDVLSKQNLTKQRGLEGGGMRRAYTGSTERRGTDNPNRTADEKIGVGCGRSTERTLFFRGGTLGQEKKSCRP